MEIVGKQLRSLLAGQIRQSAKSNIARWQSVVRPATPDENSSSTDLTKMGINSRYIVDGWIKGIRQNCEPEIARAQSIFYYRGQSILHDLFR